MAAILSRPQWIKGKNEKGVVGVEGWELMDEYAEMSSWISVTKSF